MPSRDDDRFRPRVGPPRSKGTKTQPFISRVIGQSAKAGRKIGRTLPRSGKAPRKRFGRGQSAAMFAGKGLGTRTRRATVKIFPVRLKHTSARATEQHLRYLERDGVRRDGGRGSLFSAESDQIERGEFEGRVSGDRHQFRIIVSPEDGEAIGDLKGYARALMSQAERDLGTRLEWVAIDHWDTDQPHVQILLRGRAEDGDDLVIAPDYIAHGFRNRARELATEWLGPRTELEVRTSLKREVTQERWTSLDQSILAQTDNGRIFVRDSSVSADGRFRTGLLIGRLDHLSSMGLAAKRAPLTYELSAHWQDDLRALGERGDVIRTLQRAMGNEVRQLAVFDHQHERTALTGRVVSTGEDALNDRRYLIVDGIDGRAHYVPLAEQAPSEWSVGSVVEVRSGAEPRRVDRNIQNHARDGIYRVAAHREAVALESLGGRDPEAFVDAHVRRLEALRRARIVERLEEGVWRLPTDYLARAQGYDRARSNGVVINVRADRSIEQQIRAIGATWLDEQVLSPSSLSNSGFGAEVRAAVRQRAEFLVEHGFAARGAEGIVVRNNLLQGLRATELAATAKQLEATTGLEFRPTEDGCSISGTYRRSINLVSGRFAMLDDGLGFSLVPWRPVIEARLGQPMTAVVRGNFVSWDFGRRTLGR